MLDKQNHPQKSMKGKCRPAIVVLYPSGPPAPATAQTRSTLSSGQSRPTLSSVPATTNPLPQLRPSFHFRPGHHYLAICLPCLSFSTPPESHLRSILEDTSSNLFI
ncbi:hypothetical protein ACFE04_024888 [Oxalis oulophora]